jgi:hypothetical protein
MRCDRYRLLTVCVAATPLLAAAVAGLPAMAADSGVIGAFNNWSAHQFAGEAGRVCYLYSEPTKSAGEYSQRGDTYVQVTHRVGEDTRNVVSVTAGYPYKKDSEVSLTIDAQKFSLFTDGDTAWAGDAAADDALVTAMRAGITMVVAGTSSRGTLTRDSYSLSGFTAAHKAIDKACPAK